VKAEPLMWWISPWGKLPGEVMNGLRRRVQETATA
jgi:hypothetical protein